MLTRYLKDAKNASLMTEYIRVVERISGREGMSVGIPNTQLMEYTPVGLNKRNYSSSKVNHEECFVKSGTYVLYIMSHDIT